MRTTEAAVGNDDARPGRYPGGRPWPWAVATVGTLLTACAVLLWLDPRSFFRGDTQAAYYGWWYQLGQLVRSGEWSMLDPHAWRAGNLVAEGQWGLFSPLIIVIGLLATISPSVLAYATAVKIALVCVGGLGTFAVVRSYGGPPPAAYLAGAAAPMGGMTQYLDLPSWAAGLMIWALLPWAWWATRRTTLRAANPLAALVTGSLVVTVGYVYGTIMLAVVLAGCLVDCWVVRDRAAAARVVGIGVVCGLLAVLVYLPGILTAPVTMRPHYDTGTGKFTSTPLEMFISVLPSASVGTSLHVNPYSYLGWVLPALLWTDLGKVRGGWRPYAGLLFFVVVTLAVVNGPGDVGPLRWPLRLQPFLTFGVATLTALVLARFVQVRPSARRLGLSLLWVALATVAALFMARWVWVAHLVTGAVVALGLSALWVALRREGGSPTVEGGVVGGVVGGVAGVVTLLAFTAQHLFFPHPPSPDRNLPAATADYQRPVREATGDVIVIGDSAGVVAEHPEAAEDLLVGSAWYLTGKRVQNTYTAVSHFEYHERWCIVYHGDACPEALDTLFGREPETGAVRADLLAVSTVVLVRADFASDVLATPPRGWRVAETTEWSVTWVRRNPVAGAGRPVWSTPGIQVSAVTAEAHQVRFRVDRAPADGGRVVLSALAWPGYQTDVGTLREPVEGYLLTVELPGDAVGREVTVRFRPPGWPLELACGVLAVILGVGWSLTAALGARAGSRVARRSL